MGLHCRLAVWRINLLNLAARRVKIDFVFQSIFGYNNMDVLDRQPGKRKRFDHTCYERGATCVTSFTVRHEQRHDPCQQPLGDL